MSFRFFRSTQPLRNRATPAHGMLFALAIGLLSVIGAVALTQFVFYVFPMAQRMASNADSLVLFDFARDLLHGHSVQFWNLPRAPYLFPDTVLALALMSFGWWGQITLTLIALINLLLLLAICYPVMRLARLAQTTTWLECAFFLGLALLTMAIGFPFAMVNIYWQIFASGAHFLSAAIVLLILYLDFLWQLRLRSHFNLLAMFLLCIATAVSDSLSSLLLLLWLVVEWLWRAGVSYRSSHANTNTDQPKGASALAIFFKKQLDLYAVFCGVVLGTVLSLWIPRQSLVESFLSLDKFQLAAQSFITWLSGDVSHVLYLLIVIALVLLYPACMRQSYFKGRFSRKNYWRSSVLAPALGVICITPFFYQDVGSIRYLAFPALVGLMSLALLYQQWWSAIRTAQDNKRKSVLLVLALMGLMALISLGAWQYHQHRLGPHTSDSVGIDHVGLAVSVDAMGAAACIQKAKAQWPLADGVSTYWYARPTRFARGFDTYLAQVDQGRSRSGAFVWGNNGIDLVYANKAQTAFRRYNFVLTTSAQLESRLWGNLPAKATAIVSCQEHQILYFENPNVLWDFLFPLHTTFINETITQILRSLQNSAVVNSQIPNQELTRSYLAEELFTQVGTRDGEHIMANGKAGVLVFGPYIPLAAGRYRLTARGYLRNNTVGLGKPIGSLEIGSTLGPLALTSAPIMNSVATSSASSLPGDKAIVSVDFELSKPVDNLEFKMVVLPQTRGVVTRYQLELLH